MLPGSQVLLRSPSTLSLDGAMPLILSNKRPASVREVEVGYKLLYQALPSVEPGCHAAKKPKSAVWKGHVPGVTAHTGTSRAPR